MKSVLKVLLKPEWDHGPLRPGLALFSIETACCARGSEYRRDVSPAKFAPLARAAEPFESAATTGAIKVRLKPE